MKIKYSETRSFGSRNNISAGVEIESDDPGKAFGYARFIVHGEIDRALESAGESPIYYEGDVCLVAWSGDRVYVIPGGNADQVWGKGYVILGSESGHSPSAANDIARRFAEKNNATFHALGDAQELPDVPEEDRYPFYHGMMTSDE